MAKERHLLNCNNHHGRGFVFRARIVTAVFLSLVVPSQLIAQESGFVLECFIEPYRTIRVPAPEVGVLSTILVKEGDTVLEKQVVARLDDEVLRQSLELARAAKDAQGSLLAAIGEQQSRVAQYERFQALRERDNATERELQRAATAAEVANAKVQIVRDELSLRELEFERTKAQLRKRQIEAPMKGTVIEIVKEAGEFVSPTDPVVMTIVDLSRLKAIFSIPHSQVASINAGEEVELRVGDEVQTVSGIIEFISPTTDAQSGTVRVKIGIDNRQLKTPSGSICRWDGKSVPTQKRLSRATVGHRR